MSFFLIDAPAGNGLKAPVVLELFREMHRQKLRTYLISKRCGREKVSDLAKFCLPIDLEKKPYFITRWRLTRTLKRYRASLVHAFGTEALKLALTASGATGVSLNILSLSQGSALQSAKKFLGQIDVLTVPTEGLRDLAMRYGFAENDVEIIPAGLDFTIFEGLNEKNYLHAELSLTVDQFIVGVFGHLSDARGRSVIFEAASILKKRAPKIKLIILGEGGFILGDESEAAERKIDNVSFCLGYANELPKILKSVDLVIMSSHMEGLSGRIIEAMAAGRPVVAANVPGLPEIVSHRETALLVPPREPAFLAEAILKVYYDPAFASRLAQEGRDAVYQTYSYPAVAGKIIEIYRKKAKEKGAQLV